ncbi:MFS transporter [Arthrobacter sp. NicSoilB8]|uniref:MFS transporter n=1 Tax=Arthrobacter sp. NicSoilB8 TaxID=2830998 RepID=UPI001CC67B4F|nr:MFS transporter [Arthrobacter sp. NicSoilB8]BCW73513.1 MFS transporter [Arthrobacter sp. NicSoilB8]
MDILKDLRQAPMSRLQIRAVAVATALMMIDGIDIAVAAYAAPALSRTWNLDPVTLGFLLSSGLVGMAAGSLFLTPFSDRIGRRRLTLLALVLTGAGMLLSALAADVVQLMAFRVLAGLGIGGMIANNNVFVSEYSSDKRRGSIFGIYTAGFPIGATLGGLIASPLIPQFGWRSVFVAGAAASLVMLAVAWRFLPESLDYLLSRRPNHALTRVNAIMAKMGRPLLAELPSQEQQAKGRIGELFTGRMATRTVLLWAGYGLMIAAYYFATTWTPKLMATASGDDSLGVTMGLVINTGGIAGAVLFAVLAIFLDSRHLLLGGLLASAGIYLTFGLVFHQTSIAILIGMVLGVLTSVNVCGFYATTPSLFPAALRGTGIGWMIGIGRLVSIVSPIFVGYLLAGGWPAEAIFMLFGAPLVVSALAMVAVWKMSGQDSTTSQPALAEVR